MIKLISVLISILREIHFERKEEHDFNSKHFNIKKFITFILLLILILILLFGTYRSIHLTMDVLKLKEQIEANKKECKNDTEILRQENSHLWELINSKPIRNETLLSTTKSTYRKK